MLPEVQLTIRVHGRHPWFFRKMIRKPQTPIPPASAVRVVDRNGQMVGVGFYNPRTELALRMLQRRGVDDVDEVLAQRLERAIDLRHRLLDLPAATDVYRLAHAEGDGFPGLILDRMGDAVVAQVFSRCMMERIEPLGEQLLRQFPGVRLVLTADAEAARREQFALPPPVAPRPTEVTEHGLSYEVSPGHGHKTGFFADQRDNRQLVSRLAAGRRVLDLCCHAGGFALNAARGGARAVTAIDLDEAAVAATEANARRNRLTVIARHADAFDVLRELQVGAVDLFILDPPKWIAGKRALEAGAGRYLDLNRAALAKAGPGALLVTCSCSGALSAERFEAIVRRAAAEADRDVRILERRGAGPDHPVALECPETGYLKVLVLQVR